MYIPYMDPLGIVTHIYSYQVNKAATRPALILVVDATEPLELAIRDRAPRLEELAKKMVATK